MEVPLSTMTTAAVAEPGVSEFAWRTVVLDDPRPDEVLVRIVATGLCHTDLTVLAGRQPTQLHLRLHRGDRGRGDGRLGRRQPGILAARPAPG